MKTEFPSKYKEVKAIMSQTGRGEDSPSPKASENEVLRSSEGAKQEVPDGITQTRQHLVKAANLYNLCVKCVDKMIAPHVPPIAQTSEMFQAAVGTLFIEASRMRFVDKMPSKPITK